MAYLENTKLKEVIYFILDCLLFGFVMMNIAFGSGGSWDYFSSAGGNSGTYNVQNYNPSNPTAFLSSPITISVNFDQTPHKNNGLGGYDDCIAWGLSADNLTTGLTYTAPDNWLATNLIVSNYVWNLPDGEYTQLGYTCDYGGAAGNILDAGGDIILNIGQSPRQGFAFNVPVNAGFDIADEIGAIISALWIFLVVVFGVPLAFYIVKRLLKDFWFK